MTSAWQKEVSMPARTRRGRSAYPVKMSPFMIRAGLNQHRRALCETGGKLPTQSRPELHVDERKTAAYPDQEAQNTIRDAQSRRSHYQATIEGR